MDSFERKFLEEFKSRRSRYDDEDKWITKARSFLENLTSQTEDYEDASFLLASSEWSNEGLNALAYASFCFWHHPLAIPKNVFQRKYAFLHKKNASSVANEQITKLVCQKKLSQSDQAVWIEVTHRLALASVALKAVSLREVSKKGKAWSFQAKMLKILPERLAVDPDLIAVAEIWPDCQDLCRKSQRSPLPPNLFEEKFSLIDLKKVSEKAAKVFCQVAKEFFPNDFGWVSSVRAYFPKDGNGGAGSYNYSRGKGRLVLPDALWPCMQTLPAFIAFTAHEVLHMHQLASVEKNPDPSSPFYAEYLMRPKFLKPTEFSCTTYSVRGDYARNAILPTIAYLCRPTEFLAYKFDGALQKVLAKKFVTPFVKPWYDTGSDEFARAVGVEVEEGEPVRPKIVLAQNFSSHSLNQRQQHGGGFSLGE